MRGKWTGRFRWGVLPTVAIGSLSLWLFGCGAGSGSISPGSGQSGQAVGIQTEPASQDVPIDRPATFSVQAAGTAPLQYQWMRNGAAIPGATSSSYTLPNVTSNDSGVKFQVTVSNSFGSLTSTVAVLTAGPRAPKIGDLRYLLWQQVTIPGLGQSGGSTGDFGTGISAQRPNTVGSPLHLAPGSLVCTPGECSWEFGVDNLPPPMTGLTMWYRGGNFADFSTDLQSIAASNVVVTSLALEPSDGQYGIAYVQASQYSGFEYKLQIVSPADIQATAAQDGAEGRVVTAVSFGGPDEVYLISYGLQGDPTNFDVKTMTVTAGTVVAAAKELAADGYIISAFGGDDTTGWVLIGMHAVGYSQPRSLFVNSISNATLPPDTAYFTPVVYCHTSITGDLDISEQ